MPELQFGSVSPEKIKEVRLGSGLTQTQAAEMIHRKLRTWQEYEAGDREIDLAVWELFLIKSNRIKDKKTK